MGQAFDARVHGLIDRRGAGFETGVFHGGICDGGGDEFDL